MEIPNVFDLVAAAPSTAPVLATSQRAIGTVIVVILAIAGVVLFWFNTRAARPELGAEIELAPNRKPYYADDELEGRVLDRVLGLALILIAIIAVGLPLYWLAEPGRQEGAALAYDGTEDTMGIRASRGEALYLTLACGDCHGGVQGGFRDHVLLDPDTGDFVAQVSWKAPALNTVTLRYEREEIEYILNYGRPGTPMQAFGTPGGGPLTTQQVDNLIDYLWSIQKTVEEMRTEVDDFIRGIDEGLYERMMSVRESNVGIEEPVDANRLAFEDELALGELLFNNQDLAAGSYSCSRCHVPGAAYGQAWQSFERLQASSFGPDLTGIEQFSTETQHFDLIWNGMTPGVGYFDRRQGNPQMPGFGANRNTGQADQGVPDLGPEGQLTPEQVWAIVTYERNLSSDVTEKSPVAGTAQSPTFSANGN
jgi:mono/diheme cytochrome c family protein